MRSPQSVVVDPARWDRIVQITGGAAEACRDCQSCTAVCRWGLFNGDRVDLKDLLRNAQLGDDADPVLDDALWKCATCGSCQATCTRGISTSDVILGLRSLALEEGRLPEHVAGLVENVVTSGHPLGSPGPRSERRVGEGGIGAATGVETCLVYAGPTVSGDPRQERIARALESVLQSTGIGFSLLDAGLDSGALAHFFGVQGAVEETIERNLEEFEDRGVREIVTVSPHDFDMFRRIYPRYGNAVRVFHAAEYLDQLVQYNRLRFGLELDEPRRAVYHDPCYLGRHQGVFDGPRRVLDAMPGLELLEFEENRADAVCCGGGGGRIWAQADAGEGFADRRVEEAHELGADMIVTSCPSCIGMFEDSLALGDFRGIEVRDVVEVAAVWWPYAPRSRAERVLGTYNLA